MNFLDLYEWASHQLANNQFLVGILVPFTLGVIGYLLRSVPYSIYRYIKRMCTLDFTLTTSVDNYDKILAFLYSHRWTVLSRTYAVSRSGSYLTPGYGWSIGFYKGTMFTFYRKMLDGKMKIEEETNITFFTRNLRFVQSLLNDVNINAAEQDLIEISESRSNYWGSRIKKPKRDLKTIFVNDGIDTKLTESFNKFLTNEEWYRSRGIPYKKCVLLYGPPGTGKTSLIHALASEMNMNLRVVSNLTQVGELLSDMGSNYNFDSVSDNDDDDYDDSRSKTSKRRRNLFVIEDIDCLANLKRNGKEDEEEPTTAPADFDEALKAAEKEDASRSVETVLHQLLNTLDGFSTPHGLMVFITTNHISRLDPAILRKGRVDDLIELGPLNYEGMCRMFKTFYGVDTTVKEFEYSPIVGSRLQDLFINNDKPEDAEVYLRDKIKFLKAS